MSQVIQEKKDEKHLVYSVILGAGEEDDDTFSVIEEIRRHLDAAAQEGRKLEIVLFSV